MKEPKKGLEMELSGVDGSALISPQLLVLIQNVFRGNFNPEANRTSRERFLRSALILEVVNALLALDHGKSQGKKRATTRDPNMQMRMDGSCSRRWQQG